MMVWHQHLLLTVINAVKTLLSKVKGLTSKPHWEANVAAVWGQMATGGGHSTLPETMALLNVPVMNKSCFISTEKRIGEWWGVLLEESMKLDGQEEEEHELAIARSTTCLGDPAITVILNGGWSKSTHKNSYNAKSGVAIIIRYEMDKILCMGVWNKYCSVCAQATDGKPPERTCYKTGMAPHRNGDRHRRGLQKCIEQHGVKYSKFIGDGDNSSVRYALVNSAPWCFAIEKIECTNHAVRCFSTHLETVVLDNPCYKGREKLTEAMRKRLTKAAIVMRSKESERSSAIIKLQKI